MHDPAPTVVMGELCTVALLRELQRYLGNDPRWILGTGPGLAEGGRVRTIRGLRRRLW